jgi:hypothetical protein
MKVMNEYDFRKLITLMMDQHGTKIEDMDNTRAIIDFTFFSITRSYFKSYLIVYNLLFIIPFMTL